MREMTVYGVSFDLVGKQPIVLLRTQEGNTFLPIWIGHPEAAAILMCLQGTEPQRPMTHDLATSIVSSLDAEIRQIAVTELRENTFHAKITLVRNGTEVELDARTSDAIALALRCDAKIFAADEVIEESGVEFEGDEEEASRRLIGQDSLADLDPDEFRRFLDTVSPGRVRRRAPTRTSPHCRNHDGVERQPAPSSRFVRSSRSVINRSRPAAESRPVFAAARASRSRRSRSGSTVSSPELSLQAPELRDEVEPVVDGGDDRLVVLDDLGPDLLEALPHSVTAASRAAPLKIPCTTIPG